ncbi:MAG: GNAT family N-acetyltransferase [Firmicutes bacterium]|nr:GNAT family N-acetyltransferase [Bacillota bacterium]
MIRFIRESDYTQALEIWRACFEDDEDYFRFFWENGLPLCRGLVREEDGRAFSMLYLLPCALGYRKRLLPAEYVYAVATLPAYRGRGYAGELVRYAANLAKGEGKCALCLRPGEESLYGYYAKLGFVKAFAKQESADRHGYFAWEPHMGEYIRKESGLTGRDMAYRPAESPGGMMFPWDRRAMKWLRKTRGRAYMGPALE